MKNILIICADKDLRKDLSKELASQLKRLYLDADELLDFEILNRQEVSLTEASDALHIMEAETLKRVLSFKNCVITISHDLFVANDNFKMLNGLTKVNVELSKAYVIAKTKKEQRHKLEQELCLFDQINLLINKNCDITISHEGKPIEALSQEIISKLNK